MDRDGCVRKLWCVACRLLELALVLFYFLPAAEAAIPQPPIASWGAGSALSQARTGACAALLQDGRILITGGDSGSGPRSTAARISEIPCCFSTAGPRPKLSPMQPSPIADTSRLLFPSLRLCITSPSQWIPM